MMKDAHPVLSCAEAVELERRLLGGERGREWEAMKCAGAALGAAVADDFREIRPLPENPRIFILAGKGHNAGDAFIAADRILAAAGGGAVEVCFTFGEASLSQLARRAWEGLNGGAGEVSGFGLDREVDVRQQLRDEFPGRFHLCLDGLFGMNFRSPLRAPLDEVVRWVNEEMDAELRAAVDLPSGLGDEATQEAFRADFSYMTGSAKLPLFRPRDAEWAGRIRYLDMGFFDGDGGGAGEREVLLPAILAPLRRLRPPMAHKRKFGHLVVLGGSRKMPGAILMSIMAAARSGVGLITALVPESLVASFAPVVPEAMWIGMDETPEGGLALGGLHSVRSMLPKATAMLIGPGVGTEKETQALLEEVAGLAEVPLIIDAEALQRRIIARVASRAAMRGRVVVTPHMGEYARISEREFPAAGEQGLMEFCGEAGVLTVLKGPPFTRIGDGGQIAYGLAGGPVLARGGSGDLLGGIIGSLVAQDAGDVAGAAKRAVVWHGLAAEALARQHGQAAVRTTQLLDHLDAVLRAPA